MFFSSPFGIWCPPMNPYECFYLNIPTNLQNHLSQNLPTNFTEEPFFQPKDLLVSPHLNKNQNKRTKQNQSLQNDSQHESSMLASVSLKKAMTNHNVIPNIMNSMLSSIRRRNKTGKIVEKIMKKQILKGNTLDYNLSKYFAYTTYLHANIPKSKHQSSLKLIVNHLDPSLEAFSIEEQKFYNKVCRILIFELLSEEFLLSHLTNRKCTKTSRLDHLKARRFISQLVKESACSQQLSPTS